MLPGTRCGGTLRRFPGLLAGLASLLMAASPLHAGGFDGRVTGEDGSPVVGAMVTFGTGADSRYAMTVFTDAGGHFRASGLEGGTQYRIRVRRIGWKDLLRAPGQTAPARGFDRLDFALERETDPAAVAAQLPANRWYGLVLDRIDDERHREQLVRQCTFCHQQGSAATRIQREPEQWYKVLDRMARFGAGLDADLRERIPGLFNAAYDPAVAVPALTQNMNAPDFAPPPEPRVRRAVIEEYQLGGRASMLHDVVVHPDGSIYAVDLMQDALFRLDPKVPGGAREKIAIPRGDVPPSGVFGTSSLTVPNSNSHVGPHSLQVAADGAVWITLALGNQLARFDPKSAEWSIVTLPKGFFPHTLRFDPRGRIWYTIAVSNHLGMYDPATGQHEVISLPARSIGESISLRFLPAILWLGRVVNLGGAPMALGDGDGTPVPYGIDIAPDGGVWFSQLNAHKIGRVDPDTFAVSMIDTPFTAPRRLRFDASGRLWIPGFSSGLVSRFDPETRQFESWELPIEPRGSDTPYALNVDHRTGAVWICGTNSDTLMRFEPESERFTVYPLPTRVSYTRELDFDAEGGVWTSNSNLPAWQIETGMPRILRLDPRVGVR